MALMFTILQLHAVAGYLAPMAAYCLLLFLNETFGIQRFLPQGSAVAVKVRGRPQLHSATPTSAAVMTKQQEIRSIMRNFTGSIMRSIRSICGGHNVKHHGISRSMGNQAEQR